MIKIDRSELPGIPRPVHSFVFERPDTETVCIGVHATEEIGARALEFVLNDATQARICSWLKRLSPLYGFEDTAEWDVTCGEIAERAVKWAGSSHSE